MQRCTHGIGNSSFAFIVHYRFNRNFNRPKENMKYVIVSKLKYIIVSSYIWITLINVITTGCYVSCPPDKPFCWNDKCLYQCPDTFYMNVSECVPDCGDMFLDSNRHCQKSCQENWLIRKTARAIGNEIYIEKICTKECSKNEFEYNNTCVHACPFNTRFIDGGICAEHCSQNNSLVYNVTIGNLQYYQCTNKCPHFQFADKCVDMCPQSHPYVTNDTLCDVKCRSNLSVVKTRIIGGFQHYICGAHCPLVRPVSYNSTCTDKCPDDFNYIWNGTCRSEKCQHTYSYNTSAGMMCNKRCPYHMFINGTTCVDQCQKNLLIHEKTCLETCPEDYPFWYDNNAYCQKSCSSYRYIYNDSFQCVSACPAGRAYVFKNTCMSKCPPYAKRVAFYGNKCVSGCRYDEVIYNSSCVNECPTNHPFVFEDECLESCPLNYSMTFRNYGASIHCLHQCPDNTLIYNGSCVFSCPDDHQFIHNQTCVSACPSSKRFSENIDKHCVRACQDNQLSKNGNCIQSSECTEIVFGDQCISECPEFYFRYGTCLPHWVLAVCTVPMLITILVGCLCARRTTIEYCFLAKTIVCMCKKTHFNIAFYEEPVNLSPDSDISVETDASLELDSFENSITVVDNDMAVTVLDDDNPIIGVTTDASIELISFENDRTVVDTDIVVTVLDDGSPITGVTTNDNEEI